MKNNLYHIQNFKLESGELIPELTIVFSDSGNEFSKRIIWVCHALSGSANVSDWWPGLVGENKLFDPSVDRVICANVIGSCYGTTSPNELNEPLLFPQFTIKDLAQAHELLARALNLNGIDILIGASLGGQQALEWSLLTNIPIKKLILIATNASHSAFGRAFNETQRLALLADQSFGKVDGGKDGLKAARAIAMLSYRSYTDFELKQRESESKVDNYYASSYVRYQGEKFIDRFCPYSYWYLTKAMDSHDILRGRKGNYATVLKGIQVKTLVIGIDSDLLFPIHEQTFLAAHIPNAEIKILKSPHGHDSFLIEYEKLNELLTPFVVGFGSETKPTLLKRKSLYTY